MRAEVHWTMGLRVSKYMSTRGDGQRTRLTERAAIKVALGRVAPISGPWSACNFVAAQVGTHLFGARAREPREREPRQPSHSPLPGARAAPPSPGPTARRLARELCLRPRARERSRSLRGRQRSPSYFRDLGFAAGVSHRTKCGAGSGDLARGRP